MAVGEGASRIITAVVNDAELRNKLIAAPAPQRRQILDEAGLTAGLSEEDYAELRRLSANPVALNDELLERVTGGDTATSVGGVMAGADTVPSSNAGGATVAGDVVAGASGAVVSTGMGAAAIGVAVGGAAFGF